MYFDANCSPVILNCTFINCFAIGGDGGFGGDGQDGQIVRIEVEPAEHVLLAGQSQQLLVTAIDAAGKRRCVTMEAEYESNAKPIANVDPLGLIEASDIPGEAAMFVLMNSYDIDPLVRELTRFDGLLLESTLADDEADRITKALATELPQPD